MRTDRTLSVNAASPEPAPDQAEGLPPSEREPSVSSNELLRGRCCLQIRHNGMIYRLQVTRQGKLILTK